MNDRNRLYLSVAAVGVSALAFAAVSYFNVDSAEKSSQSATSLKSDQIHDDEFLVKGGDPLARATDKFYAQRSRVGPDRRSEMLSAIGVKQAGATPAEIKTLEAFPLEMIDSAESVFEERLVVYLKDGRKWSNWTADH